MQLKSDKKLYSDRLGRLHAKRGVTWDEIAKDLGVGVAMLMMVRGGKRGLSAKSLYRLEEAERAAGIAVKPETPVPLFNPANDPQVAQRAADIMGALDRDTASLPSAVRERINGHFLQLMLLMAERAAVPAQQYMDNLKAEVDADRAAETDKARRKRTQHN